MWRDDNNFFQKNVNQFCKCKFDFFFSSMKFWTFFCNQNKCYAVVILLWTRKEFPSELGHWTCRRRRRRLAPLSGRHCRCRHCRCRHRHPRVTLWRAAGRGRRLHWRRLHWRRLGRRCYKEGGRARRTSRPTGRQRGLREVEGRQQQCPHFLFLLDYRVF